MLITGHYLLTIPIPSPRFFHRDTHTTCRVSHVPILYLTPIYLQNHNGSNVGRRVTQTQIQISTENSTTTSTKNKRPSKIPVGVFVWAWYTMYRLVDRYLATKIVSSNASLLPSLPCREKADYWFYTLKQVNHNIILSYKLPNPLDGMKGNGFPFPENDIARL